MEAVVCRRQGQPVGMGSPQSGTLLAKLKQNIAISSKIHACHVGH
jgi:hypothetical protein